MLSKISESENQHESNFGDQRGLFVGKTDNQIWEGVLIGHDEALAELYTRYANKLYNYGTQITLDHDLAFDIVQDVFLNLVSKKGKLGAVLSIKNYLYASYRRALMRALKRNRRLNFNEDYDRNDGFQVDIDDDFYALSTSLTIDVKKLLHKISNDLPIRQREIITLYFFEQLSYQEIAEVMAFTNVRSARNLLYKALKSMSQVLKKHEDMLFLWVILMNSVR